MKHVLFLVLTAYSLTVQGQYPLFAGFNMLSEVDTAMFNNHVTQKTIRYWDIRKDAIKYLRYKYNNEGQLIYYGEKMKGRPLDEFIYTYSNGKPVMTEGEIHCRMWEDGKRKKGWTQELIKLEYSYSNSPDSVYVSKQFLSFSAVDMYKMGKLGVIALKRDDKGRLILINDINTVHNVENEYTWQYDSLGRLIHSSRYYCWHDTVWIAEYHTETYALDNKNRTSTYNSKSNPELSQHTIYKLNEKGKVVGGKGSSHGFSTYYFRNGLVRHALNWRKGKISTTSYSYKYSKY